MSPLPNPGFFRRPISTTFSRPCCLCVTIIADDHIEAILGSRWEILQPDTHANYASPALAWDSPNSGIERANRLFRSLDIVDYADRIRPILLRNLARSTND